jgi:hypothetical protein
VYTSYVFRIVFPILDYIINYSFIVAEMCIQKDDPDSMCYGKCYLSNELKKQMTREKNQKEIVNIEFINIPHVYARKIEMPKFLYELTFYISYSNSQKLHFYFDPLTPPPKYG